MQGYMWLEKDTGGYRRLQLFTGDYNLDCLLEEFHRSNTLYM